MSVASPQGRVAGAWSFSAVHSADTGLGFTLKAVIDLTAELEFIRAA